jgi:hypothetical protein
MTVPDRAEMSPKVMLGKSVIRGTLSTVELIVGKLGGGVAQSVPWAERGRHSRVSAVQRVNA